MKIEKELSSDLNKRSKEVKFSYLFSKKNKFYNLFEVD